MIRNWKGVNLTQRGEEPSVLSAGITVLKGLLHSLLCFLPLWHLLERVIADNTLQSFELESVTGGHEMVVVDGLDEWLDLASLGDLLSTHSSSDSGWISLNTDDESVGERVCLWASLIWLDDHDLKKKKTIGNPSASKPHLKLWTFPRRTLLMISLYRSLLMNARLFRFVCVSSSMMFRQRFLVIHFRDVRFRILLVSRPNPRSAFFSRNVFGKGKLILIVPSFRHIGLWWWWPRGPLSWLYAPIVSLKDSFAV